jgi:Cdc6-like AAA superfamily ATPase
VFVLDEVDLMSEKDKHKDILYLISRSPNNYMAILLSNNPKFLSCLDQSIISTLQPEIVHFRNYNAIEMEKILTGRARAGLRILPKRAIREIAAMTVKNTNSDVRVAIKTLYLWALEPDVPLKEHFEKARRDIMSDVVKDLNDKNLLILKAAFTRQGGYVSYVHFYSNLSYLQSLGLTLLISTKINRTYTNRIQLTFDPGILAAIWNTRFG